MIQGPCKVNGVDCQDRTAGCNGNCPKWAEYQDALKKIRDARYKEKAANHVFWQTRHKNKPQSKKGVPARYAY